MIVKQLYIHAQINVARLLIENDVVDINNEILTSITNNRFILLKPAVNVLSYLSELEVLETIYMYIHTLNYKIRRV